MLALWIVEHLDVFEYIAPRGIASGISLSPDPLAFQELKEALGDGVVMTVPATAHRGFQIVLTKKRLPFMAGELATLIGMNRHLTLRLTTPYGHQQSLQGQVGRHP